ELVVGGDGAAVLLADGAETRQFGPDVLQDLHGARQRDVAEALRGVEDQLNARVPAEDLVLGPAAGGRDVEPLARPDGPGGAGVRAAVLADADHDDVAGLAEESVQC